MQEFEHREDVEEWLAELGYDQFWNEADRFGLSVPPREDCDRDIASGATDRATVLNVLKALARLELVKRYDLRPRDLMPWHALH